MRIGGRSISGCAHASDFAVADQNRSISNRPAPGLVASVKASASRTLSTAALRPQKILTLLADPRRLSVEGFDQFQNCSVRIFEAEEFRSTFVAESNYHRIGNEIDASHLQSLIFLVEILGEKRDAGDACVVQVRIWLALRPWLLPFDQVEPSRTRVVTQR